MLLSEVLLINQGSTRIALLSFNHNIMDRNEDIREALISPKRSGVTGPSAWGGGLRLTNTESWATRRSPIEVPRLLPTDRQETIIAGPTVCLDVVLDECNPLPACLAATHALPGAVTILLLDSLEVLRKHGT